MNQHRWCLPCKVPIYFSKFWIIVPERVCKLVSQLYPIPIRFCLFYALIMVERSCFPIVAILLFPATLDYISSSDVSNMVVDITT